MRRLLLVYSAALGLTTGLTAETITAVSSPFTFPALVSARPVNTAVQTFVRHHWGMDGRLYLTWSFPAQPGISGKVRIVSLSGRQVAATGLNSSRGSMAVNLSGRELARGVYFARIDFGHIQEQIKLVHVNR